MGYNYIPGTPRYNGATRPGAALTIGLDYYTILTTVNIMPMPVGAFADVIGAIPARPGPTHYSNASEFVAGTIPNDFSQDALDRLVEILSQRGQPVILGSPTPVTLTYTAPATPPPGAPANGATSPGYSFRFAIEHPSSWGVTATATPATVPLLTAAIQSGGIDFGFNTDFFLNTTVAYA